MNVVGAGIDVNWATAKGHLRYRDLEGTEWQTRFRYRVDSSNNTSVEILGFGRSEDLGEYTPAE
jgi:hypothetical protein